jgi:hypothetical protein
LGTKLIGFFLLACQSAADLTSPNCAVHGDSLWHIVDLLLLLYDRSTKTIYDLRDEEEVDDDDDAMYDGDMCDDDEDDDESGGDVDGKYDDADLLLCITATEVAKASNGERCPWKLSRNDPS